MERMTNKNTENNSQQTREREIAFIAASVAAGCIPCLDHHRQQGLTIGLTQDEILKIARYAHIVRRRAEEHNIGALDTILTGHQQHSSRSSMGSDDSNSSDKCC
jgi:AhpD family alkylhydroperoxidase